MIESKPCKQCGDLKPLSEFPKGDHYRDGHRGQCNVCVAARQKVWKQNNYEKLKKYKKDYRIKNCEKNSAYARDYYRQNREKVLAGDKKYRENNPEKLAARKKRYREKNREALVASSRKYYLENKKRLNEHRAKWAKTRRESPGGSKYNEILLLSDNYILGLLTNNSILSGSDIPVELIVLKRAQLQLTRELKEASI